MRAISELTPPGACVWRGDLSEGFLRYEFGGLIFGGGGDYTWRGLFDVTNRTNNISAASQEKSHKLL